ELRVIAGRYGRHQGPALTHSPLAVWDVQLKAGKHLALDLPKGHTCAVVVLRGTLAVEQGDLGFANDLVADR
ncbi:pirin-like C-terminal cupin domain-containing protein, partial [Pseudomonas aeruginosa]